MKMTRASGAGNTFLIVDALQSQYIEKSARGDFARKACTEIHGFTTDGFIFLDRASDSGLDFDWDFYNSDGSVAEMCGNAARCVTMFYFLKVERKAEVRFKTLAGIVVGSVMTTADDFESIAQVKIKMPIISGDSEPKQLTVKLANKNIRGCLIDSGVPHFVIESEPDEPLARALRKVKDFGPRGANITFIEMNPEGFIQAVTFERGVEDFTLACGTGAVAAAKFHRLCFPEISQQTVEMPGGELIIAWNGEQATLTGEARLEFDLNLYEGIIE